MIVFQSCLASATVAGAGCRAAMRSSMRFIRKLCISRPAESLRSIAWSSHTTIRLFRCSAMSTITTIATVDMESHSRRVLSVMRSRRIVSVC